MASTKKQDKTSTVPEHATLTPSDQALDSPPNGSDATTTDAITSGVSTAVTGSDPGAETAQQAGPPTQLLIEPASVGPSTADAASAGTSPSQLGQADHALEVGANLAAPGESDLSTLVEVNPAKVEVYPLRSFMDEGELRRRGGPSYRVPKLHAEELEHRKLISRTPLEE